MDLYERKLHLAKLWLEELTEDQKALYTNERELCDAFVKENPRNVLDWRNLRNEREFLNRLVTENPTINFTVIRSGPHWIGDSVNGTWTMVEYYSKETPQWDKDKIH